MVVNPRKILNLEIPEIKEGVEANLTLFNTDEEWVYSEDNIHSKSKNSPWLNDTMTGRATAIYSKGQFKINNLV